MVSQLAHGNSAIEGQHQNSLLSPADSRNHAGPLHTGLK